MKIFKNRCNTFYKLLQDGQLKGLKEGNRYKVPASSVEDYIRDRMQA
ncbi:MAG: helix-turn-helix domain-containing protein [Oscillospiraceae bacterium]|nr:helix-turn-helix domain-containing protein [Oscillospiraceae bacterium]